MPIWNEELQQWGYLYHEEVSSFQWLGISRVPIMEQNQNEERENTRNIDFGNALRFLRKGRKVSREGWNGKNMWLALQVPDAHSKMTLPYIYMYTAQGDLVPWLASQTDILASDWGVIEQCQ